MASSTGRLKMPQLARCWRPHGRALHLSYRMMRHTSLVWLSPTMEAKGRMIRKNLQTQRLGRLLLQR